MKNGKRMTVREVAEALGVSPDTVYNSAKEFFPGIFQPGKTTCLTEAQATEVKMNLRKNSEVMKQPKTDLEKELIIRQAIMFQQEKIERLQAENRELAQSLTTVSGMADWLIKGHQKLGEAALEKYGGPPYWFEH